MSNLCSARGFSLPRFGSKRDEKKPDSNVVRSDELYGFFPKKGESLRRTGTLPVRIKPSVDKKATQILPRHRSLLPGEKKNVVPKPVLPPRCPLQIQIPQEDHLLQGGKAGVQTESRRRMVPTPPQQQRQDVSPLSPPGPWCSPKLNTSLNSSGNSLNDSGIDSGGDSTRHTDSSRVSFSSYGSLYPSPRPSPAVYGVNWRLQGASISRPANIPLWVRRDYEPSSVERGKMRVTSAKRGEIVNALYRTNEWVMVRTSQDETGFIPFAYTEPLDARRLSRDFTQQYPEWGAPLWRPSSSVMTGVTHPVYNTDTESHTSSAPLCASMSTSISLQPQQSTSRRYDPDLSVLEDCANVEFFHRLEPRLARDRNPVIMSSQLSMVPHIGSDVSCDVSYDYDDYEDDYSEDINSLDVSIDSNCTESSVFTVTDTGIQLTVLFKYSATQENDISVEKGDIVLELNTDDPDWTWVRTEDGEEGFVPSTYVVNLRKLNLDPRAPTTYL